jgi:hypothetical protein
MDLSFKVPVEAASEGVELVHVLYNRDESTMTVFVLHGDQGDATASYVASAPIALFDKECDAEAALLRFEKQAVAAAQAASASAASSLALAAEILRLNAEVARQKEEVARQKEEIASLKARLS